MRIQQPTLASLDAWIDALPDPKPLRPEAVRTLVERALAASHPPPLNSGVDFFDLPEKLKLSIADGVTLFSRIDTCLIELIWAIEDADLQRKKEVAKAVAAENIRFVRRIVERGLNLKVDAIWKSLEQLRRERNFMAHGVWLMVDIVPHVLWHSKMLESDDYVSAEPFDYPRFDRFFAKAKKLLDTFQQFKALIGEDEGGAFHSMVKRAVDEARSRQSKKRAKRRQSHRA